MHLIRKFFNDQKWTIDDLKQTQWTKLPGYENYYLGATKNEAGNYINCNGVQIWNGNVIIAYFDQDGMPTDPFVWITEGDFKIHE